MSSKRMPLDGKSGNWRRPDRKLTLRRASSAGPAGAEEVSPPSAFWLEERTLASVCVPVLPPGGWNLGCGALVVGSGFSAGGCEAVEALSDFCVEGEVLSGWPCGGWSSWATGLPLIAKKERGREERVI